MTNPTQHDYEAAQEHAPAEPQTGSASIFSLPVLDDLVTRDRSSAMGFAALASAALPVATFVMIVGATSTVATAFGAALLVLGAIFLVIAAAKAMAVDEQNVRMRRLTERVEQLENERR